MAEALAVGAAANIETLKSELAKSIKQFEDLGENPDDMERVKDLRAALANASAGTSEHENQVFSHLLTFFSRYFDKGDFISQRRYKGDTYRKRFTPPSWRTPHNGRSGMKWACVQAPRWERSRN